MKVVNECRIAYEYRFSQQSPLIIKTAYSNFVYTEIIENRIEVTKYVNKKSTYSFDVLTYTVIIKNISRLDIKNILFKDEIPSNTDFIENSFTVNKKYQRCVNPQKGYLIEKLKSQQEIEMEFKVVVLPFNMCCGIKNYSTATYGYIYNVEKPPLIVKIDSNKVRSKYEFKVFKQISVNTNIYTCDEVKYVKDCYYDIDIIETKIINNLNSNLSTLVILGGIKVGILYLTKNFNIFIEKYIEKYTEEIFGFSTYMIVPSGINLVHNREIMYDIENISVNIIKNNKLFVNIVLLLYY